MFNKMTLAQRYTPYMALSMLNIKTWKYCTTRFSWHPSSIVWKEQYQNLFFIVLVLIPVVSNIFTKSHRAVDDAVPLVAYFLLHKLCVIWSFCGFSLDQLRKTVLRSVNGVPKHLFRVFKSQFPVRMCRMEEVHTVFDYFQ